MDTSLEASPGAAWHSVARRRLEAGGVAEETLDFLLRSASVGIFAPDRVIASADEPFAGFILDGYAQVRLSDAAGHQFLLTIMRRGQGFLPPFGEDLEEPSGASIELVGLTAGVVEACPAEVVRSAAERDNNFALRLLDTSGSMFKRLLSRLEEVEFRPARERLAVVLLAYAPLLVARPPILTRATLAGLIGTSREMLGALLRDLEADGTVARSGRALIIHDKARLRHIARWDEGGREHFVALRGPRADDPLLDKPEELPSAHGGPNRASR